MSEAKQAVDTQALSKLSLEELGEILAPFPEKKTPFFVDLNAVKPVLTADLSEDSVLRQMEVVLRQAQTIICHHLETIEGAPMMTEERFLPEGSTTGSGGRYKVFQGGKVFEKAAVHLTVNRDVLAPFSADAFSAHPDFVAAIKESGDTKVITSTASISLIIHPVNPNCPTSHANYRYMQFVIPSTGKKFAWFGGGSDLSPMIVNPDDAKYFHGTLKKYADKYDPRFYPAFKQWADVYYCIAIYKECRGIGGTFFDDWCETSSFKIKGEPDFTPKYNDQQILAFIKDMALTYAQAFYPLVLKHMHEDYTEQQVRFQRYRRGRYALFNLLYDRGTKFGLAKNPEPERCDHILASIPLQCEFPYRYQPANDAEKESLDIFRNPREWA